MLLQMLNALRAVVIATDVAMHAVNVGLPPHATLDRSFDGMLAAATVMAMSTTTTLAPCSTNSSAVA